MFNRVKEYGRQTRKRLQAIIADIKEMVNDEMNRVVDGLESCLYVVNQLPDDFIPDQEEKLLIVPEVTESPSYQFTDGNKLISEDRYSNVNLFSADPESPLEPTPKQKVSSHRHLLMSGIFMGDCKSTEFPTYKTPNRNEKSFNQNEGGSSDDEVSFEGEKMFLRTHWRSESTSLFARN